MRFDLGPGRVMVTLSRRNLLALLVKLDQPGSVRTLVSLNGYDENGDETLDTVLVVRAEQAEAHYADRPQPGPLHPATEQALATLAWIDDRDPRRMTTRAELIRLVAVADLHGNLPAEMPERDVLALVGDLFRTNPRVRSGPRTARARARSSAVFPEPLSPVRATQPA